MSIFLIQSFSLIGLVKHSMNEICFFNVFIFHIGLLYSQSLIEDYNYFTPERRQVLSKMGTFLDETIRKNFPAETESLSYSNFGKCTAENILGNIILNVDRDKLKEINRMLFKDHNYYFFYARYIYMGKKKPLNYVESLDMDSVPTVRGYGSASQFLYGCTPVLNDKGYIKVLPADNPAIMLMKEDMEKTIDLSLTIFIQNVLFINVREMSQPIVKELCAVAFWRYLCLCGGVNLLERKSFCESCNLQ